MPSALCAPWRVSAYCTQIRSAGLYQKVVVRVVFSSAPGRVVRVKVIAVDVDRQRIGLTLRLNDTPQRVSDADMKSLLNGPAEQLAAALDDARDRLLHGSRLKEGAFDSATFPTVAEIGHGLVNGL